MEYKISCSKCGTHLLNYKKKSSGGLVRLFVNQVDFIYDTDNHDNIICPTCEQLVATKYLYKPEKRYAYRLITGTYRKKK